MNLIEIQRWAMLVFLPWRPTPRCHCGASSARWSQANAEPARNVALRVDADLLRASTACARRRVAVGLEWKLKAL